jgi:peptide deformylase
MGLRILYSNDSLLRKVSRAVAHPADLDPLIDQLKDAIRYKDQVWTGSGLSICAVQIGTPLRVILLGRPLNWALGRHHKAFDVLINPAVLDLSKDLTTQWEGCLSIPDKECLVNRHSTVTISYTTLMGKNITKKFNRTAARVIQHEIDHLNGVLITDKALDTRKKLPHN